MTGMTIGNLRDICGGLTHSREDCRGCTIIAALEDVGRIRGNNTSIEEFLERRPDMKQAVAWLFLVTQK